MSSIEKMTSALKQRGYKLTPQRCAVLGVIALSREHLTPAAIYEKVHQEYPGIGLVTIYRTLEILTELGFVCEVHAGGNCRSYLVRRPAEHHHHLICSDCGAVVDFIDPTNPVVVASVPMTGTTSNVVIINTHLYISELGNVFR